jgi:DNA-binding NtrC family response regulator
MEAGVDREVLMTSVDSVASLPAARSLAPHALAPQTLAPQDIVPLLIGATVGEIERELVLQTLARCDGNRTRAARVLGLSVRTLRNKIRLYAADGVDVPAYQD